MKSKKLVIPNCKFLIIFLTASILLLSGKTLKAQNNVETNYEPSHHYPFGRINPDAPKELADYEAMIGISDCKSESIKPDQTWSEPIDMTWKFRYIMNGMAVQDETLKEDANHSGSIRQYSVDSAKWYVHYYATNKISSVSKYHGNKQENDIVLYKSISDLALPNGTPVYYRLTFYEVTNSSFKWIGEWVDIQTKPDKVLGSTWKISCKKRVTKSD